MSTRQVILVKQCKPVAIKFVKTARTTKQLITSGKARIIKKRSHNVTLNRPSRQFPRN